MAAYGLYDAGFPGMKAGIEDTSAIPAATRQPIAFGTPVFFMEGDEKGAYPFTVDQSTIKFSADFIASNSTVVTVNTLATAAVVYATSHAATFAAVVVAVEALTGVDVVASDATLRTITVRTYGASTILPVTALVSSVTTLGSSQPTVTYQFGTTMRIAGVAMHQHKEPLSGLVRYEIKDPASIMREGKIYVLTADTTLAHKPAYLTAAGAWTDETVAGAVANLATPYFFRTATSGAGMAILEVFDKPAI